MLSALGRDGVRIALHDVAAAAREQCLHTGVSLCLVGQSAVVTESLFQIDEPNADKDASAPGAGEYVRRYGKAAVAGAVVGLRSQCPWGEVFLVGNNA